MLSTKISARRTSWHTMTRAPMVQVRHQDLGTRAGQTTALSRRFAEQGGLAADSRPRAPTTLWLGQRLHAIEGRLGGRLGPCRRGRLADGGHGIGRLGGRLTRRLGGAGSSRPGIHRPVEINERSTRKLLESPKRYPDLATNPHRRDATPADAPMDVKG